MLLRCKSQGQDRSPPSSAWFRHVDRAILSKLPEMPVAVRVFARSSRRKPVLIPQSSPVDGEERTFGR